MRQGRGAGPDLNGVPMSMSNEESSQVWLRPHAAALHKNRPAGKPLQGGRGAGQSSAKGPRRARPYGRPQGRAGQRMGALP